MGWGLEVGIDVTDKVGVSATILEATELSLDYQINDKVRLRGGSNFDDNAVLSIEYETNIRKSGNQYHKKRKPISYEAGTNIIRSGNQKDSTA